MIYLTEIQAVLTSFGIAFLGWGIYRLGCYIEDGVEARRKRLLRQHAKVSSYQTR